MDRLAAVVAATWLKPNNDILVIDAGTCVTYDFIDAQHQYHGGNISPRNAHALQKHSIYLRTSCLKSVPKETSPLYGQTTETAIRAGVIRGMELEMSGYISLIQKNYPEFWFF